MNKFWAEGDRVSRRLLLSAGAVVIATALLTGVLGAESPAPEKKRASSTAQEEADESPTPAKSPSPKKKATPKKKKKASSPSPAKTPSPKPSSSRAQTASDQDDATPAATARTRKKESTDEETPTPSLRKKKNTPSKENEESTPAVRSKRKSADDQDATAPPSKAAKKKAAGKKTPSPSSKSAKHKSEQVTKPKPKETPEPDNTPKPEKTPSPRAVEGQPFNANEPPSSPSPARAVPATTPTADAMPPADITVQKSGLQEDQGFEPPPPPPPRRGFWSSLFGRRSAPTVNYRYLSRGVIEAIRNAPVQRGRWKFIVVHNSGTRQGNARAFDYYHRNVRRMQNGLAYHFVIGNGTSSGDGEVEIGSRWRRQINGGHVHSDYLNNIALGICLVGDFNRTQPTAAQLDACEELIRYLRIRCGKADGRDIPVRPHREVNPPRWSTDCPGDAFPYVWFRRFN